MSRFDINSATVCKRGDHFTSSLLTVASSRGFQLSTSIQSLSAFAHFGDYFDPRTGAGGIGLTILRTTRI